MFSDILWGSLRLNQKIKLRNKLLLSFVSLNIVISISLVVIISHQFSGTLQEEFLLGKEAENNVKINQLETFLKLYSNKAMLLNSLPVTKTFVNIEPVNFSQMQRLEGDLTKLFIVIMENDPLISSTRFIDEFGQEQIRVDNNGKIFKVPKNQLQDKSTRSYFIETSRLDVGQVYVSNIELNQENGVIEYPYLPTMRFSIPLIDALGQRQGIFVFIVKMEQEFQNLAITDSGSVILIDDSGEIKVHEDQSKLFGLQLNTMQSYFLEQPELKQNLNDRKSLLYFDQEEEEYRMWTKINYDPLNSERFWVLINTISTNELNGYIASLQYSILSLVTVLVIITVVITVFISSKLTKNIIRLKNFVTEISNGNLDSKLRIKSNDEIGELVTASKKMQQSLKQYRMMVNSIERELKDKVELLEEANVRKDEFSSMVTHELKTPIFPIIGYCKMLKNSMLGKLTKEQENAVDIITKNAKQLETLIQDVMDARKLDLEKMRFNLEPLNLDEFFDSLNENYSVLKESGIDFIINKPQKNIILNLDTTRIRQVFDNLISNAIKFIPKKNGRIEVGANFKDNHIILFVKDNGAGIPKETQKNLFRKFYQVDTSERRPVGGTGLGLAISKGIVEKLGGSIWVESDGNNSGTTFFIKFKVSPEVICK